MRSSLAGVATRVSARTFAYENLAPLQGTTASGQCRQRPCHPHLLTRCAHVDARSPGQPVRAGEESGVPAFLFVELTQHHQQFVRVAACSREASAAMVSPRCSTGLAGFMRDGNPAFFDAAGAAVKRVRRPGRWRCWLDRRTRRNDRPKRFQWLRGRDRRRRRKPRWKPVKREDRASSQSVFDSATVPDSESSLPLRSNTQSRQQSAAFGPHAKKGHWWPGYSCLSTNIFSCDMSSIEAGIPPTP